MKRKSILALTLAMSMLLAQSSMMVANAQVNDPNVELTKAYPLLESDNLLPEAKEIKEISFTDMDAHWAVPAVKVLSANGYVQGMGNGTFAPEKNVTRAEFVTMAINALGLEKVQYTNCVADVAADKWYADVIEAAIQGELLDDVLFTDNKFSPDSDITREDAALIITKVALKNGAVVTDALKLFTDDAEISEYAKDGVSKANSMGLIAGYPDGSFKPKATLTRAEASELLVRAIEKAERLAIYVDPENGSDEGDGSKNAPLASIAKATELVKANNDDMKNHLFVFLKGGEHYLPEEIKMNEEHSGSNGYNIVYTSYGDGNAQLMRAKHYSGFELADADLNIYKLYVGDVQTRQVFIDGIRATRARSVGGFTNGELVEEFGFYSDDTFLADFKNIKDLETVSYSKWTQPRCGVSEITVTDDGKAKIVMVPEGWAKNTSAVDKNTPWTLPSWYENAYELLDLPGEWYIDSADGYLYYIPRPFENPMTMVATIPDGSRMITMDGTVDAPIHNITFDNLEFAYNTWMRPSSEMGFVDGQNCYIDSGLPEPAVLVERARYVDFTNNTFQKLGSAALQMMYSIQECDVIGNEFSDLSANGFSLGKGPGDVYETEIKPTEYKYYTINNRVNNNYIHDIGVDYGSATGISTTWPKNTQFNHNEIANVNYSGMHMGYGWGGYGENQEKKGTGLVGVELCYNYIHDVMNSYLYDGGCIYTLGATGGTYEQPNLWTNNYFESSRNAHAAIYPDEGSTYWLIENNVVDYSDVEEWPLNDGQGGVDKKWLHIHTDSIRYNTVRNNYATTNVKKLSSAYNNVEDPILVEDGKWPAEAQNIISEAGLEKDYLTKFEVDVQRFNLEQDSFVAQVGETRQIDVTAYGRKQATASEDKYTAYYVSTNPEIATVDESGKINIIGEGEAKIYVNVLADGIIRTKTVNVIGGDKLKRVRIDSDFITVVKGFDYTIKPQGITELGRRLDVDYARYTSEDESIIYITEDGRLHGVKKGETTVNAKYTIDGVTVEEKIPVTVISYGNEETVALPSTKLSGDFFDPANWKNATVSNDGKGVSVTGSASYYVKEKLAHQLYSFDMTIDNPNSWPSLALCAPDKDLDYSKSDCYFIGFKADHIEVQRFKDGQRTMFFGESTFNPTGGVGIPNDGQILEYGKTYNVTVGTIEEEEGVRLILTINGSNILDYLDSDENCLRAGGHLGVYVGGGTFTFSPYTGE